MSALSPDEDDLRWSAMVYVVSKVIISELEQWRKTLELKELHIRHTKMQVQDNIPSASSVMR